MLDSLYKTISERSAPALKLYLKRRVKSGKEDPNRINERQGITAVARPEGKLVWIHAASVGEAQSALILLNKMNDVLNQKFHALVTTGTRTSAQIMADRLPSNAIHQYATWDHPSWVNRFLDHWKPDMAFWMESELWPNTLHALKEMDIPCALVNARMSASSFRNWSRAKQSAKAILSCFDVILCQTETHHEYFTSLGAKKTLTTDNLKYSATPLPYNEQDLTNLKNTIEGRPVWLYASTHAGEEELACKTHKTLKAQFENILTIIVPRHPERTSDILTACEEYNLNIQQRTKSPLPSKASDIYIADTLGELGLFYKLVDIAVIGRSFSNDGGGGHNPIEASLLDCAVLTGSNYQNQQELFDTMRNESACLIIKEKDDLAPTIQSLFNNNTQRQTLISQGLLYASNKANVINHVMEELEPLFLKTDMSYI